MLSLQISLMNTTWTQIEIFVCMEFHWKCFYWQLVSMLNKEDQKNNSVLVGKSTRQVSKNIALLSQRGNQDLLTWNIKKYSNWKSQNITFTKVFLIFSLKSKQFCYKCHTLTYKLNLKEYITITCKLILETDSARFLNCTDTTETLTIWKWNICWRCPSTLVYCSVQMFSSL